LKIAQILSFGFLLVSLFCCRALPEPAGGSGNVFPPSWCIRPLMPPPLFVHPPFCALPGHRVVISSGFFSRHYFVCFFFFFLFFWPATDTALSRPSLSIFKTLALKVSPCQGFLRLPCMAGPSFFFFLRLPFFVVTICLNVSPASLFPPFSFE